MLIPETRPNAQVTLHFKNKVYQDPNTKFLRAQCSKQPKGHLKTRLGIIMKLVYLISHSVFQNVYIIASKKTHANCNTKSCINCVRQEWGILTIDPRMVTIAFFYYHIIYYRTHTFYIILLFQNTFLFTVGQNIQSKTLVLQILTL